MHLKQRGTSSAFLAQYEMQEEGVHTFLTPSRG